MKVQVITKELWQVVSTPDGSMSLPTLPVYESRLRDPILFWWDGEKAVRCPHKRVFGRECDFSYEVKMREERKSFDFVDAYYEEGMTGVNSQIQAVMRKLAEAADKGRIVLRGEENCVRIVHFIKLHLAVEAMKGGWMFRRISAFVAEVFEDRFKDIAYTEVESFDNWL